MDIKQGNLEELFGSFRAEWLEERIYPLFNEPQYFPYLTARRSCVLIGGRGSGKTTALKCMSYEGQTALGQFDHNAPSFVGLYQKLNTNTVRSFSGTELSPDAWRRVFGHFFNLTICAEAIAYIRWIKNKFGPNAIIGPNYPSISTAFGLEGANNVDDLAEQVENARLRLEIYINNFGEPVPTLSPLQTPLNAIFRQLQKLPGHARSSFYIILDEYENLLDYQQVIVNTILKHSGNNYFFKVGVRELGWRERSTLNPNETLVSPADYERIHIEEDLKETFSDFAKRVCEARLRAADLASFGPIQDVALLLPKLTLKEEAERLGVKGLVSDFRATSLRGEEHGSIASLHDFEIFVFLKLNGDDFDVTLSDLQRYATGSQTERNKYENHGYALIFAIGGKGRAIKKYYAGHDTLALITHRNIRFYMQLLNECIREQLQSGLDLGTAIDPELQTKAARQVGLKYLRELEGVSSHGAMLTKLILGFGRIFQVLAANPIGGKPECNQFELTTVSTSDEAAMGQISELLTEAIMHMALVRIPGTKPIAETDMRSWEYGLHPIFSPYFNYSHRQKRKLDVKPSDIAALIDKPKAAIKEILGRRSHLADDDLPVQMSMFDDYFR